MVTYIRAAKTKQGDGERAQMFWIIAHVNSPSTFGLSHFHWTLTEKCKSSGVSNKDHHHHPKSILLFFYVSELFEML